MSYIGRLAKGSLLVGTGLGNVELPVGADGSTLQADSAQTNGVKWQAARPGITSWVNNTAVTTVSMAVNTGYLANNQGNIITYTLPATSSVGDEIRLVAVVNGIWALSQNSGQTIQFGTSNSTVGVSGGMTLGQAGDCIHLVCTTANTGWQVIGWVGNPTIS